MRKEFIFGSLLIIAIIGGLSIVEKGALWAFIFFGPIILIGYYDFFQKKRAILRNFPILGHFRYILESIRPEIQQYFIEDHESGVPFSRERRSVVYQRAKNVLDTLPFGTQQNVYEVGYEWVNHSLVPTHPKMDDMRVLIGGEDCKQPYSASMLNVSAMSFGALSKNAIMSLNRGAKLGGFAHNTGEGGISPHHKKYEGDLIWQIGTGYFGARDHEGNFSPELFKKNVALPQVKMIEIKLSQGAKPGHGGILPAAKLTEEIAEIRHVPMGQDVNSPPSHSAFSTPIELLEFVKQLRDLSDGKPVGFKMCIGKRREFLAICKAMVKTGIVPDFIVIDGGEGGTGAAPLEFSNFIGSPLTEALVFAHNALVGYGVRKKLKVIASGKILTGFDMVKNLSIGADLCYSARGMMMSLGCIQALRCNANVCPAGVATQDPDLVRGLVVEDKYKRVANFQHATVESMSEIIGSMGLSHPSELRPWHRMRRTDPTQIRHYGEIYEFLRDGDLLNEENLPKSYARACQAARPDTFTHIEDLKENKTA